MNPTEALHHLLTTAGDDRHSNASLGASVRSHLSELQALSVWLGTFRGDAPKSRNIKQRLASMADAIETQEGFQWDAYQQVCRDALLELQARDRILGNARMALNSAAGKLADASVHLHEAIRSLGT